MSTSNATTCPHCGLIHGQLCPSVKAYEYHPDGSLKRVEFRDPPPVEAPSWYRLVPDTTARYIDPEANRRAGWINLPSE